MTRSDLQTFDRPLPAAGNVLQGQTDQASRRPPRQRPLMRRYEVACMLPDGSIHHGHQVAPDSALFLSAFTAFAHGTPVATVRGPVPVEDLVPGDRVLVIDGDPQPVLWIGSTIVQCQGPTPDRPCAKMLRIQSDAFGIGRPSRGLLIGPGARVLEAFGRPTASLGGKSALADIQQIEDGQGAISTTPPAPVRLYHIALARHEIVNVDGLWVESYHPGALDPVLVGPKSRELLLRMFPHMSSLSDFGPLRYARRQQMAGSGRDAA